METINIAGKCVCTFYGTASNVDYKTDTITVTSSTHGEINNVPVHFHCQNKSTVKDGSNAFTDGDEVAVLAVLSGGGSPSADNSYVVGFKNERLPCFGYPGVHLSSIGLSGAEGGLTGDPYPYSNCALNNATDGNYGIHEAFYMADSYRPRETSGEVIAFEGVKNYFYGDDIPWYRDFLILADYEQPDLWSATGEWGDWWRSDFDYLNFVTNRDDIDIIWNPSRFDSYPDSRRMYGAMIYYGIRGISVGDGIRFRGSVLADYANYGIALSYDIEGPMIINVVGPSPDDFRRY